MAKKGLTRQQEMFVREIAKGKSQREAYHTAYPKSRKWKPESVDARASNLANKNDKVLTRITELRAAAKKATDEESVVAMADIIRELKSIAFADILNFAEVTAGGNVKLRATKDIPEGTRRAIVGVKEGAYGTEVKLGNKLRALEMLMEIIRAEAGTKEPGADDGFVDAMKQQVDEVWQE